MQNHWFNFAFSTGSIMALHFVDSTVLFALNSYFDMVFGPFFFLKFLLAVFFRNHQIIYLHYMYAEIKNSTKERKKQKIIAFYTVSLWLWCIWFETENPFNFYISFDNVGNMMANLRQCINLFFVWQVIDDEYICMLHLMYCSFFPVEIHMDVL